MKDVIKRIITDFHQSELPEIKNRDLEVPLDLKKIITIIGPRRAGKTFYLFQLKRTNENIFFLKNIWEYDFLIVNQDRQLSAIQVTEYLSHDNYDRELKGLEAVRKRFDNPDSLLLVSTVDPSIILPEWCNSMQIWEWLLTSSGHQNDLN